MRKVLILVSFIFLRHAVLADQVQDRGHNILKSYRDTFTAKIDSANDQRVLINWAYSSLVLNESQQSIDHANKILVDYLSDKREFFTECGSEGHTLYWELVILSKIVNDDILSARLEEETDQAIKAVLFDFSKNFDDIKKTKIKPGEPIVAFNSDNHDMIHRGVFLMIAQALKDDDAWKTKKYNDGAVADKHYKAWSENLIEYFRFRASHGINIEVGSVVYAGVYLQPIFIIRDNCQNRELCEMADKFLDLFFADVAQETINGVRGGAKSRVYKDNASYQAKFDKVLYYNHILFGLPAELPMKNAPTDCFAAAYTDYRSDEVIVDLMTNGKAKGRYLYVTNRLAQGSHTIEDKEYAQGYSGVPTYHPEIPSNFLRTSYVTENYVLGTFTVDERQNYMLINSQNQWMGVVTNAGLESRITIQLTPTSDHRTGYRELQAVAVDSAAVIRKQLAAKDTGLIRVYLSPDMSLADCGWLFGSNGNNSIYYAIKAFRPSGKVEYCLEKHPDTGGKLITFNDPNIMLVIEMADAGDFENLEIFKKAIETNDVKWLNNNDEFLYTNIKNNSLKVYTYNRLPEINGKQVDLTPGKCYESPYINGVVNENSVKVKDTKGRELVLDFN